MNIKRKNGMPASLTRVMKIQSRIGGMGVGMALVLEVAAVLLGVSPTLAAEVKREQVTITSLEELAEYAGQSGNRVRMEPGVYRMTDYIPLEEISEIRQEIEQLETISEKREAAQFITFTGNDNVFDLGGVTIEFDTELRSKLDPPIHTPEFVLSGNDNVLKGLTIINTGEWIDD